MSLDPELVRFLASLAAVSALVGLAHLLGFSRAARLDSEEEARELFRHTPGGFEPESIALDRLGKGAIARDSEGHVVVLVPHGIRFVPRRIGPGAPKPTTDGLLSVPGIESGERTVTLDLGEMAAIWAANDADAR